MSSLPYVTATGNIKKALEGIRAAAVPEKVSQDFVKTILKIPGGSGDQMTSFLKKTGLANSDGSPSELYRKFRNPSSSGAAIAECIKKAYAPLYVRNEFMHELSDEELLGLAVEQTGEAHDSSKVKMAVSSIKQLKDFADFQTDVSLVPSDDTNERKTDGGNQNLPPRPPTQNIGLNLGYTINLNLPATDNPAVFDAIFKSLKDNLMSPQDG